MITRTTTTRIAPVRMTRTLPAIVPPAIPLTVSVASTLADTSIAADTQPQVRGVSGRFDELVLRPLVRLDGKRQSVRCHARSMPARPAGRRDNDRLRLDRQRLKPLEVAGRLPGQHVDQWSSEFCDRAHYYGELQWVELAQALEWGHGQ